MTTNSILAIKSLFSISKDEKENQEKFDLEWDKNIKEYKYDSKSYMKNILNIDEKIIKDIYDYYEECSMSLILNSSNISEYRKKLISVLKDEIIITSSGNFLYKDKNNDLNKDILMKNIYSSNQINISNFFRFLVLQYKEDVIIDNIYNDIGYSENKHYPVIKSEFSYKKPEYLKSFFFEEIENIEKNNKPALVIQVEKIYERFIHKNNVNYLALASIKNKKFPIKLKHNKSDSGVYIISTSLQEGNCNIRVIQPMFEWYETINQKNILVLHPYSWILEKG